MSEFKGTKGPWDTRKLFEKPELINDDQNNRFWHCNEISVVDPSDNGRIICNVNYMTDTINMGWGHNNDLTKWEANALLISKAPEMLEMLERIVQSELTPLQIRKECKNLIKSATEL
jgi:hypothetical protein